MHLKSIDINTRELCEQLVALPCETPLLQTSVQYSIGIARLEICINEELLREFSEKKSATNLPIFGTISYDAFLGTGNHHYQASQRKKEFSLKHNWDTSWHVFNGQDKFVVYEPMTEVGEMNL